MSRKSSQYDPRIDAYIAKSAEFAQPILNYLRATVHAACPQVAETMKWSRPHFDYKGMLCGMSAFKEHCSFGFWKGSQVVLDRDNKNDAAMGQFGRIVSLRDLPPRKTIVAYVHVAMKLNDDGVKPAWLAKRRQRKPLPTPADLQGALKRSPAAKNNFDNFSPSQQREYIEWIVGAKGEDTRKRRLATTIEWVAQGKTRNWKYEKKRGVTS